MEIPVYWMFRDGNDRAMSRSAFATDLPAEVIWRKSKGRVGDTVNQFMRLNLSEFRELLLDGIFVQERIINRNMLERFFANPRGQLAMLRVLLLGEAEIFFRRWHSAIEESLSISRQDFASLHDYAASPGGEGL